MAGVCFRAFPPEPAQDSALNAIPGSKEIPPSTAKPVAYFFHTMPLEPDQRNSSTNKQV